MSAAGGGLWRSDSTLLLFTAPGMNWVLGEAQHGRWSLGQYPVRGSAELTRRVGAMDCDQVFAVLTRGPFPSGLPSDLEVEQHLEQCGQCWLIANALRPAKGTHPETLPACENRRLPGYWGDASPPPSASALHRRGDGNQPRPSAPGSASTALATVIRPRTQRHTIYRHTPPVATLRDLKQIALILSVVVAAASLIGWLLA